MKMSIEINGLRMSAHIGVSDQERRVGNVFTVDVHMDVDVTEDAWRCDELCGTVSYADVVDTVRAVMSHEAKLLEHVAWQLVSELRQQYPAVVSGRLRLAKITPPLGVELDSAAIVLDW